jgi:hypothetical protein
MTKQEFEEKLSSLLKDFEKDNEEVELYFSYFSDDLDKVHSWEDNGFEFITKPELLENERNHEDELFSLRDKLNKVEFEVI